MFPVNKEEAKAIRENFPNVHIVRTMKQKSKRGHYFCEESEKVERFLEELKNGVPSTEAGADNRFNEET